MAPHCSQWLHIERSPCEFAAQATRSFGIWVQSLQFARKTSEEQTEDMHVSKSTISDQSNQIVRALTHDEGSCSSVRVDQRIFVVVESRKISRD